MNKDVFKFHIIDIDDHTIDKALEENGFDKQKEYSLQDIIKMPTKVLDQNIFYLFNCALTSGNSYDFNKLGEKDQEKANFYTIKKLTHSNES